MSKKEQTKEVEIKFVLMTNKELTKEFVEGDIKGGIGAGNDMSDYKIIDGEIYKIKKLNKKSKMEKNK